jgi:hypothetical protein
LEQNTGGLENAIRHFTEKLPAGVEIPRSCEAVLPRHPMPLPMSATQNERASPFFRRQRYEIMAPVAGASRTIGVSSSVSTIEPGHH